MTSWLSSAMTLVTGTEEEESVIDGLPNVASQKDATAAIEKTRALLQRHLQSEADDDDEWEEVLLSGDEFEGVRLFEQETEGQDVHALKCVGLLEGVSGPQLANLLWESSLERRQTWDPNNSAFEVVEEYEGESPFQLVKALYTVPVPLISDREFLNLRVLEYEDGVVSCFSCPCNVKSIKQAANTVRATLTFGLRAIPKDNGIEVITYACLDMRGSLPAAVVNMGKVNSAKQLAMWRHYDWPDSSEIKKVIG